MENFIEILNFMHKMSDRVSRHLVLKNSKLRADCQIWKVGRRNIAAELKYHCSALLFHNYVIIALLLTNHIAVISHLVL